METSVLVTGGSGYFAKAFARYTLINHPEVKRLFLLSRGEYAQSIAAACLKPLDPENKIRWIIGDVRDLERLKRAFKGIDLVVHAAALKRIETGAYNPDELVKTNVMGSLNVVDAAMAAGVGKCILLSSDKAYAPVSAYGASKLMAEYIFRSANNMRGWHGPIFSICRYGNVAASTGSVIPTWKRLVDAGETVSMTDPECTRFWMHIDEAVKMVIDLAATMQGGELVVPELPAYRLGDLAQAMGAEKVKTIGLPAHEKLHENMDSLHCSASARRMSIDELKEKLNDLQG